MTTLCGEIKGLVSEGIPSRIKHAPDSELQALYSKHHYTSYGAEGALKRHAHAELLRRGYVDSGWGRMEKPKPGESPTVVKGHDSTAHAALQHLPADKHNILGFNPRHAGAMVKVTGYEGKKLSGSDLEYYAKQWGRNQGSSAVIMKNGKPYIIHDGEKAHLVDDSQKDFLVKNHFKKGGKSLDWDKIAKDCDLYRVDKDSEKESAEKETKSYRQSLTHKYGREKTDPLTEPRAQRSAQTKFMHPEVISKEDRDAIGKHIEDNIRPLINKAIDKYKADLVAQKHQDPENDRMTLHRPDFDDFRRYLPDKEIRKLEIELHRKVELARSPKDGRDKLLAAWKAEDDREKEWAERRSKVK